MTKEKLLEEKKHTIYNSHVYELVGLISEDEMKFFSIRQLEKLCEIAGRLLKKERELDPFYTLSVTEILQKETGKIFMFENDGTVREESREEYEDGRDPYWNILEDYKKGIYH